MGEKVLVRVHITLNKNAVHGDVSAMAPGGVRIGAPAMTTRGLKEGDFLTSALEITLDLQKKTGKKLVDFLAGLKSDTEVDERLDALCSQVEAFAGSFAMPGH